MKSTRDGAEGFWAVAEHFHERGDRWAPVSAGYELRRVIEVRGSPWTVCFKVHVVPSGGGSRSLLKFKSSITVWPPELSREEEVRVARGGWFRRIEQALRGAGYHGKWIRSPQGRWADFWKDLARVSDVWREARQLESLNILSDARRR
jgi:hypothetical protein